MTHDSIKRPSIEDLLQRGLELYGQNRTAEAIRCWNDVLAQSPGEQRALDYLESAGVTPAPSQPLGKVIELHPIREQRASAAAAEGPVSRPLPALDELHHGISDREAFERLLREKRFEEALEFLYKERERAPEDASITRGIRALKDHLTARYGRELGSLDQVPVVLAPPEERRLLPAEKRDLLRLVDGIATFGDVLISSRFGRFETCRLLALMLKRGVIGVRPHSAEPTVLDPRELARPAPTPPVAEPPSTTRPVVDEHPPAPASAPPPASHTDPYAELFASATEAYLRRDYDEALRLFEECVRQRPQDRRAEYNLRKLKERKGSP